MIPNYEMDRFGVIHQIEWRTKKYDSQYISYYEGLWERTIKLGYQRLGWVMGLLHDENPENVLEFGYGLGTFLEAAQLSGVKNCCGCDVANYPLPQGCSFLNWQQSLERTWDLVAMFDVLEHVPDLSFLEQLKTKYLAIAVPWCRWTEYGDDWLAHWRMLLPDEHLHHFCPSSLQKLLEYHSYELIDHNTFEHGLRRRSGENEPGVFSSFFRRKADA